jgi:peptide/nickel transport system permease protein
MSNHRLVPDISVVVLFFAVCVASLVLRFGGDGDLANMLAAPSIQHWLGTDNMGRDLLGRLGGAIVASVLPLWAAMVLASAAGIGIGVLLVLFGELGIWASLIKKFVKITGVVLAAVPVGIFVFALAAWLEVTGLVLVVAVLCGLCLVRNVLVVGDLFRRDAHLGYWRSHEAMGGSLASRVLRYGVADGWTWALVDLLAFHAKAAVAVEAALSYLQFGVQEPDPSFGNILASHFELALHGQWRVMVWILGGLFLTAAFPGSLARVSGMFRARRKS